SLVPLLLAGVAEGLRSSSKVFRIRRSALAAEVWSIHRTHSSSSEVLFYTTKILYLANGFLPMILLYKRQSLSAGGFSRYGCVAPIASTAASLLLHELQRRPLINPVLWSWSMQIIPITSEGSFLQIAQNSPPCACTSCMYMGCVLRLNLNRRQKQV